MKVYGWTAIVRRSELDRLGAPPHIVQARCIIAEKSMAAIGRRLGVRPTSLFNLCETGNAREIATATARPGVFFVGELSRYGEYIDVPPEAVR